MTGPPRGPVFRKRLRHAAFGLSTLLGRPRGFFIPYRYAASVRPQAYPALEPAFRAAERGFFQLVSEAELYGSDILQILGGAGPARFDQDWFPRLDAIAAYVIVRSTKPRRVVEIGSGHSTRFLARAAADGALATEIVAIDPAPRAALPASGVRHVPALLDGADPQLFQDLQAGDVLFVDSSHVAVPGSDVDRIVGDVLPRLGTGTLIHIHDILLPDPYPEEWSWRAYNEASVVAALIGSGGYEIVFSSHWMASRHPDRLSAGTLAQIPLPPGARETSLWLRKR